jgi:hypothetical protein
MPLLCLVACSDDEKSDDPDGTGGGTSDGAGVDASGSGGSAGDGSSPADGITISGIAREFALPDPFVGPPLAGVEVCVHEASPENCATSDEGGAWALSGVPKLSDVLISFTADGMLPVLRAVETSGTDGMMFPDFEGAMTTPAQADALLPGVDIDSDKAGILFFITMPGSRYQSAFDWLRGFTVSAEPTSGNGPLYIGENNELDPDATESVGGWGHYVNLEEDEYTLTFTVPDGTTCNRWQADLYGYPTSDVTTIKVPTVAGFTTGPVGLFCTPDAAAPVDAGADGASAVDAGSDAAPSADAATD